MSARLHNEGWSAIEERVAAIWSDVLGVPVTRTGDDFLALGGDSLQAMRVLARLLKVFAVDVPIASFFLEPTVGAVACLVEGLVIEAIAALSDEEACCLVTRD